MMVDKNSSNFSAQSLPSLLTDLSDTEQQFLSGSRDHGKDPPAAQCMGRQRSLRFCCKEMCSNYSKTTSRNTRATQVPQWWKQVRLLEKIDRCSGLNQDQELRTRERASERGAPQVK